MSDDPEPKPDPRLANLVPHQFKPGQSGNPAGRAKGARTKLSETFLKDLLADWEDHGAEAISEVRENKPHEYLKVVASIVPKEFHLKVDELDELTDEQLDRRIAVLATLVAQTRTGGGAEQEELPSAPEPPGGVPTLQ